jgi:hypothetical protein
MITSRLKLFVVKAVLLFLLYVILFLQSCQVNAQSSRYKADEVFRTKIKTWENRMIKLKPRNRPIYLGFDASMSVPQHTIKSNVEAINNLTVNYLGALVGGVVANPVGKIRAGAGLYYSGSNTPYTNQLLTANISASLYLLRFNNIRYHTFEPYAIAGVSQMRNQFYGNYLSAKSSKTNYSTFDEPYIGSVDNTQLSAGAGVEYQLENDERTFVHLYAEVTYGTTLSTRATNVALAQTSIPNCLWITVGMTFGKFK